VTLAPVHDDAGIEEAIAAIVREPKGGLICLPDSFNEAHRDVTIAAAARRSLPLIGAPPFLGRHPARIGGMSVKDY
jgi:hypothetical protein